MRRLFAILLALAVLMPMAKSHSNSKMDGEKLLDVHHVGLTAGFTTGIGLSYRYWPGKLGVQATFLPIYYAKGTDGNNFVSLGLTGVYELVQKRSSKLFLYTSGHYINNAVTYTKETIGLSTDTTEQYGRFNAGVGVGFDARMFGNDDIRFNLMTGAAAYNLAPSVADIPGRGLGFLPTIETSIFFRF